MNSNNSLYSLLEDRYTYNPVSGRLHYKKWFNGLPKVKVGQEAGYINQRGYVILRIAGKLYREHQLVWLLFNKELVVGTAEFCIDHIDRNPSNNRIENLRKVSQRSNTKNRGHEMPSGHNNIYTTVSGTYFVKFCYGVKVVNLWTHKTIEEAVQVINRLEELGNTYENALLVREEFRK